MRTSYDVDDPEKIQGRDDIELGGRNLATTRLERGLRALTGVQGAVLILGAGAGRYPRAISRYRPDLMIVAGDISPRAVAEADARRGKVAYLVMDAQRLPFVEESFHAVVFFDLLEHVPHPDQLLRECARILTPGGLLHFFVPLEDEPTTLYRLFRSDNSVPIHRWKRDHVGHIQRFSRREVIRAVWDAGLEVTLAEASFHLVGQVHDIVDYWQRERRAGGHGIVPLRGVDLVARATFLVTWRLSWAEDRALHTKACASGLHITARKPSELDV